jgi:hypothetical protein
MRVRPSKPAPDKPYFRPRAFPIRSDSCPQSRAWDAIAAAGRCLPFAATSQTPTTCLRAAVSTLAAIIFRPVYAIRTFQRSSNAGRIMRCVVCVGARSRHGCVDRSAPSEATLPGAKRRHNKGRRGCFLHPRRRRGRGAGGRIRFGQDNDWASDPASQPSNRGTNHLSCPGYHPLVGQRAQTISATGATDLSGSVRVAQPADEC